MIYHLSASIFITSACCYVLGSTSAWEPPQDDAALVSNNSSGNIDFSNNHIQVKIVRKGVNYVSRLVNVIITSLIERIKLADEIPLVSSERGTLLAHNTSVHSYKMTQRSWVRLIESNSIVWHKENVSIEISGKLSGRLQSIRVQNAQYRLKLSLVDVSIGVEIFEKNARLYAVSNTCGMKPGQVDMIFDNPMKLFHLSMLNRHKDSMKQKLITHFETEYCNRLSRLINEFNQKMSSINVNKPIFAPNSPEFNNIVQTLKGLFPRKAIKEYSEMLKKLYLDCGLTRNPIISYDTINLFLSGRLSWKGIGGGSPVSQRNPPDNTLARSYEKMVYITVSDYVFNSMLYHIHQQTNFDVKLNAKEMPHLSRLLRFSCSSDEICLNQLFPELARDYYDHSMEIKFSKNSSSTPRVEFKLGHLVLHWDTWVTLSGVRRSRPKTLLAIDVSTQTKVKLWFNTTDEGRSVLNGTVRMHKFDTRLKYSAVPEIDQENMASLNLIMPIMVEEMMTRMLAKGLPMPELGGMQFSNSNLRLLNYKMRLETDMTFKPSLLTKLMSEYLGNL